MIPAGVKLLTQLASLISVSTDAASVSPSVEYAQATVHQPGCLNIDLGGYDEKIADLTLTPARTRSGAPVPAPATVRGLLW